MKKLRYKVFKGHDTVNQDLSAARANAMRFVNEDVGEENLVTISESFCDTQYQASKTLEVCVWFWKKEKEEK